MKGMTATVMGSLLFFLTSCNNYIEKSKYEESQAQLQKTRTELEQTKKQLGEAQKQINELSTHKFSTYSSGFRTWRFDSVTGDTCVLLTAEWDWKKKETKSQSCNCQDARATYWKAWVDAKTVEERKSVQDGWGPWIKEDCGQ